MCKLTCTMSRFAPECPLHWWDGDVGCRRQIPQRGMPSDAVMSISMNGYGHQWKEVLACNKALSISETRT